jgi:predicted DNA-binding transcriptional regulator AlpA
MENLKMRRLLNPREVAGKLGRSPVWFTRHKDELYAQKFPRPVLGDCEHGRPRWDESAIDAWLDMQMPQELRAMREKGGYKITGGDDMTATLTKRLQQLAGDA